MKNDTLSGVLTRTDAGHGTGTAASDCPGAAARPTLFDPLQLGALTLPNRIVMAPMTRARGTREHVPTPMMAQYYAQRAGAGLMISEAIGITQQGLGWPYATGIWSIEQIMGWRQVTGAVHAAGGRIVAQLWHMGRVVDPSFLGGAQSVSASATAMPDLAHTYSGKRPAATARPLQLAEIPALLDDFRTAAKNAIAAGFDGVQIHAANGYLIDQFLRDSANFRNDSYGGAIGNRVRLLKEVAQAVADEVGADRVGVRLSPNTDDQGVSDSAPGLLFPAAAQVLDDIGVAYVELREPPRNGSFGQALCAPIAPLIRMAYSGVLILNSDYGLASGAAQLDSGAADAIAYGRPFIANPDLVRRFANGIPLAQDARASWFTQDREGYLDYLPA